jgi:23S rRNA pseudouridine1911/1915/1917 synthase
VREEIPAALAGERVDRVVSMLTGLPRAEVAALVEAGEVRVGGKPVRSRSRRMQEGEVVELDVPEPSDPLPAPEPNVIVPVVHADDHVVVVDKPAGLVVHPGAGTTSGTMVSGLLALYPELADVGERDRPGIVHRLDAGTSGLLVVARTALAYESLVGQLSARTVGRRYRTLVLGHIEADAGVIDAPIGRADSDPTRMTVSARGREARTRYEVKERLDWPLAVSDVECRLETGRTHQIRVHLAAIGHPVAGDQRYGGERPQLGLARPFLHAHHLAFDHPATGERMELDSPLPADLEECRGRLR